jgi:hypothetical protein
MSHREGCLLAYLGKYVENMCLFLKTLVLNFPKITTTMPNLAKWNEADGCNGIITEF